MVIGTSFTNEGCTVIVIVGETDENLLSYSDRNELRKIENDVNDTLHHVREVSASVMVILTPKKTRLGLAEQVLIKQPNTASEIKSPVPMVPSVSPQNTS